MDGWTVLWLGLAPEGHRRVLTKGGIYQLGVWGRLIHKCVLLGGFFLIVGFTR